MTTATPRTTPSESMNLFFVFEFQKCLDLSSAPLAQFAAVVRVLQNTQNLVISRVTVVQRMAKTCRKVYNARAQPLFCALNLLSGGVLVAVAVVVV